MKYSIFRLIVLIWVGTSTVFGQETFLRVYPTQQEERAYEAIQTENGNFIIVGKRASDYHEDDVKGLIMLIDENGQLINEFTIDSENNSWFCTINKKTWQKDNYILTGFQDSALINGWIGSAMLFEIDENIEIISKNIVHQLNNILLRPWKTTFKNDSTLLLLTSYWDMSQALLKEQIFVTEVRFPADSVHSFLSEAGITSITQDIIYIPENKEIHIAYFGGLVDDFGIKILRLDEMLNRICSFENPSDMFSTACETILSDSTYLLTATAYRTIGTTTYRVINILEMDKQGDSIKGVEYYNHQDTAIYAGAGTNTVIINDSIFVVGIHNIDPGGVPWQNTPTWLQVTKMDLDLNILSHHYYGGDAMYFPYCITSTNDNGVLITGYMWDYNQPNNQQHDVFALKLNSDGMIVNIPDNATWQAGEAILYPNPAGSYVNI
nr:hypothetical protein [Bacteroidota bacterium]